jgi:putative ABC transport system permease protein
MRELSLVIGYGRRLLLREWRRFVLPFLSLAFTSLVLLLVLFLTDSSRLLLDSQAKELLGGDVEIESVYPLDINRLWSEGGLTPSVTSTQINFNATIQSESGPLAVSLLVVDNPYPLYGEIGLEEGVYSYPKEDQIYLSSAAAERLEVSGGDVIKFGEYDFTVAGIVSTEPTSLFAGFRFLPRVFISDTGFLRTGLDTNLLRAEYEYLAKFDTPVTSEQREAFEQLSASAGLRVDWAGEGNNRLVRGLGQVTEFLVLAVLVTAVLAAVNVYASTLYLITTLRRSLAVFMALGMLRRTLLSVLTFIMTLVVSTAVFVGSVLGIALFYLLVGYVGQNFLIDLPWPEVGVSIITAWLLLSAVALGAFAPVVLSILKLSPRQVLISGESEEGSKLPLRSYVTNTSLALLPLTVLAAVLLDSVTQGMIVISIIAASYAFIALLFLMILKIAYRHRYRFGFLIRSVIAEKKADGLFGIVSFTSLFIALLAVSVLVLVQVSLERFLTNDLSETVPSVYVIDIQPSQKDEILAEFNDINLFANVGSRINRIDDVLIQAELAKPDTTLTRELGREFNLTFGTELPEGEVLLSGERNIGAPGTVSVDAEFAGRSGIELGSEIEFLIQGFPVTVVVTSLRETNSRSGLPFFYFILSPEDIEQFPATYFGYAYYDEEGSGEIGRFLATNMPNVSIIETAELGPLLIQIISTLLTIVYIIALPPLVIATILIATLVVSSYSSRRREGARLRALGAKHRLVRNLYLAETVSLTLVAAISAYALSVIVAGYLAINFIGVSELVWFDLELLFGLGLVVGLVLMIGYYLFTTDRLPLRQLLAYEDSH